MLGRKVVPLISEMEVSRVVRFCQTKSDSPSLLKSESARRKFDPNTSSLALPWLIA